MEVGSIDPSTRFRCADPDHEGERSVPLLDFHQRSRRQGGEIHRYYADHCRKCANRRRRLREQERRAEDPEYRRRRSQDAKRWVQANPEAAKQHWTAYAHSEKGQRRRNEYRASERAKELRQKHDKTAKGRARQKRTAERKRKERIRQRAHIPTAVVLPFLRILVGEAGGNPTLVDDRFGVPHGMVYDHLREQQHSASDHLVEQLCMTTLCSEVELRERADEWSMLTGANWPEATRWHRPQPKPWFASCAECGKTFRMTAKQNTRHRKGLDVFCTKAHASKNARRRHLEPRDPNP